METTQVPVTKETRRRLRWAKALTFSDDYDEAINFLLDEWGADIPDGDPTSEALRERLAP